MAMETDASPGQLILTTDSGRERFGPMAPQATPLPALVRIGPILACVLGVAMVVMIVTGLVLGIDALGVSPAVTRVAPILTGAAVIALWVVAFVRSPWWVDRMVLSSEQGTWRVDESRTRLATKTRTREWRMSDVREVRCAVTLPDPREDEGPPFGGAMRLDLELTAEQPHATLHLGTLARVRTAEDARALALLVGQAAGVPHAHEVKRSERELVLLLTPSAAAPSARSHAEGSRRRGGATSARTAP